MSLRRDSKQTKELSLNRYHILIHCLGREVVALKRQSRFKYFILMCERTSVSKRFSI